MTTIEFQNVGRGKKTWRANVKEFDEGSVYKALKRGGALMSRDIDFDYDPVTQSGDIFVGGFRRVGSFRVVDPNEIDVHSS